MIRRIAGAAAAVATLATLLAAAPNASRATAASGAMFKWPPWLSIEYPVNPYDRANRDALLLVHAAMHSGVPTSNDLSGSAEGIVHGKRTSVALRFDATSEPGVFAVRRQWPANGSWVLRLTLAKSTTALVALNRSGTVASVDIPMQSGSGESFPRAVAARDVDSALALLASRP